jgi:hypothetical protein
MFRFFKILFLLAIILVCGAFVYAKIASLGPEDNYFNTYYRGQVAVYPAMRKILGLHYDGDAKSDYLGSGYKKIFIEVDALNDIDPDTRLLDRFAAKVESITGKQVSYLVSNTEIPLTTLTDNQVASVVGKYKNAAVPPGEAGLYLLFAGSKKDEPKLLGATHQENSIILYQEALKEFTKDSSATFGNYAFSTLLHEFGHQLGLDHNDISGCLMNPKAENNDTARFNPGDIIIDFCELEMKELARLKLLNP